MFNSLASYILGNGNRNATDITKEDNNTTAEVNGERGIDNYKFVTTSAEDEDDEWLLIEKRGNFTQPICPLSSCCIHVGLCFDFNGKQTIS